MFLLFFSPSFFSLVNNHLPFKSQMCMLYLKLSFVAQSGCLNTDYFKMDEVHKSQLLFLI